MKRFWTKALGTVLALVLGIVGASEIWPERAAKLLLAGLNLSAGLQSETVETSFGEVHYLEGGKGQTIVFLHGIYALKEHWIDTSRYISGDYRLILLDLPGFGQNQRLDPEQYDYQRQAHNVLETLDAIGVEQFHIAANSMGAQIAGQLAVSIPERVQSVAFIGSPVGVSSPTPSDMELAIEAGHKPLVVTSYDEYEARMSWLFPKEPFIPRPIARFWASNEVSNAESNAEIWNAVASSNVPKLEELATGIVQPTLVLWCDEDRIFHPSGAAVLAEALPNATLVNVSGCGHLPMLDKPAETARILSGFLN
ncbi:Pimeloyl-ACP methyl ester carboxylesterase [Yoonia tamlensis]|uniref:Pimeloyl-ACP methyl ester carboxylesterase n=1 Tax=Yoonia tamlensis TaxID=390270 RepID=A0A1I6GM29_9RHOB|nr:alpha/beta hydrolase [Yoonia tamlensis]SFR43263.1 Pimeloyl-ACP methyl ester carboxylesterase [Yoonia tamlensis]